MSGSMNDVSRKILLARGGFFGSRGKPIVRPLLIVEKYPPVVGHVLEATRTLKVKDLG